MSAHRRRTGTGSRVRSTAYRRLALDAVSVLCYPSHGRWKKRSIRTRSQLQNGAVYTGIGRNTLRRLVDWGKIPVLRIGRKSIVRVDVICCFMQINEGRDLLDRNQVLAVK